MIRILYISHEGHEILGSTLSLANHLHALRHEVEPFVVLPCEGAPAEYLRSLGYDVMVIPFKLNVAPPEYQWIKRIPRKVWDSWVNYRACQRLSPVIQERGIQVIHTNTSVTLFGYQLQQHLANKVFIPHVWHLREFQDLDFGLEPFCGWKELRSMVNRSQAIVGITQAILDHYVTPEGKPHAFLLNDAVRSKDQIGVADKEPYLLFCGKVIPEKGAELALDIFAAVHRMHPDYRLKYAGAITHEYQQILAQKAEQLGVAAYVAFLGFQSDIRPVMEHASALLMCSRNEAQGRVTIEAMFYGTPVVAMAAGGTLEIVRHQANGLLFHTTEEAIQHVCHLLDDPLFSKRLIEGAHQTALSRFSEEVYCQQMLSIYQSVQVSDFRNS